ncbi:SDR family NAD(P)-dependent oxidoreductase [Utexia brackfieldae]|uniref:SDR family oxidoreductase n=1 Tax=Utexia brackfieldae TaxID=3074108 RepID=UPI00370DCFC1
MRDKKLVFITAGSQGIGAAIVTRLAQYYRVVFSYRNHQTEAQALAQSLCDSGAECYCYRCDVTNTADVQQLCETLLQDHGVPYGVIHNAGMAINHLQMNTTITQWQQVIETNLNAIFYFNHYLLNPMIIQGDGCIVTISSIAGIRGNIGQTSYSASKAAQIGMTKSLAKETGRFNIRVNTVAPGLIETEMTAAMPENHLRQLIKTTPLGRIGQVDEVASMVAYLLSDNGRFITGQTLVIDGGLSI